MNDDTENNDNETLGVNGEALLTKKEIKDAEARYHEGYEVVRRLLLYVLTRNMRELATNIRKDPKLQEACADLAERSVEYFEWLDHDRELLQCAQARLLVADGSHGAIERRPVATKRRYHSGRGVGGRNERDNECALQTVWHPKLSGLPFDIQFPRRRTFARSAGVRLVLCDLAACLPMGYG